MLQSLRSKRSAAVNVDDLPEVYRRHLASVYDSDEAASVTSSISWRTYATESAPSELLSFKRGAIGSLTGRFLAKLGETALAPIENSMIKRELAKLNAYLETMDNKKWDEVASMARSQTVALRVFEALRPMYPKDIRMLAHNIVHLLCICGQYDLTEWLPRLHFATRKEYQSCVREHSEFLLSLYDHPVLLLLLPESHDDSSFTCSVKESICCITPRVEDRNHLPSSIPLYVALRLADTRSFVPDFTLGPQMTASLLQHISNHMNAHGAWPTLETLTSLNRLTSIIDICLDTLSGLGEFEDDDDSEWETSIGMRYSLDWLKSMGADDRRRLFQLLIDHGNGTFVTILKIMHFVPSSFVLPWDDIEKYGDFDMFIDNLELYFDSVSGSKRAYRTFMRRLRRLSSWNEHSEILITLLKRDPGGGSLARDARVKNVMLSISERNFNVPSLYQAIIHSIGVSAFVECVWCAYGYHAVSNLFGKLTTRVRNLEYTFKRVILEGEPDFALEVRKAIIVSHFESLYVTYLGGLGDDVVEELLKIRSELWRDTSRCDDGDWQWAEVWNGRTKAEILKH